MQKSLIEKLEAEYEFEIRGGQQNIAFKLYWPAMLRLRLERRDALDIMRQLLAFIESEEGQHTLSFMGKHNEIEGDAP